MLDATMTLVAILGVVGACSAGLMALPWSGTEVRESIGAWSALGKESTRLLRSLTARSGRAIPVAVAVPATAR